MKEDEEIVWVKCTLIVPVVMPKETEDFSHVFYIEENHCPGTGNVGSAIEMIQKEWSKKGFCWACALQGENEIIDQPQYGERLLEMLKEENLI